jgi:hypothetical protein
LRRRADDRRPSFDAVEFFGGANDRGEGGKTKFHDGAVGSAHDWFRPGAAPTADRKRG